MATVGKDGYIRLGEDIHYYSVPHTYIGKKLKLSYTSDDVQIFDGYTLVASHTRSRMQFEYSVDPAICILSIRLSWNGVPKPL